MMYCFGCGSRLYNMCLFVFSCVKQIKLQLSLSQNWMFIDLCFVFVFLFIYVTGGYDAFNHGIFHQVGKYYWDCDKRGVFVASAPHSSSCRSTPAVDFMRQDLSSRMTNSLSAVWSLRLRILKTSGSSIPALGGLAVWGYVAYCCPAPLARSVLFKWHNMNQPQTCPTSPIPNVIDVRKSGPSTGAIQLARAVAEDDFEIPEEFLDGLTCDIMAMPVRLPSGNVIDERTLERFAKQEAAWGRPPSDPFTAQPISASHRPVYDTALKARIDSFLLKESHRPCLKNVPRTTGPIQTRSSDTLLQLGDVAAVKQPSTSIPPPPAAAPPPPPSVVDPSRRWLSNVASSLQHLAGSHISVRPKVPAVSSTSAAGVKSNTSPSCSCGFLPDGRPLYTLPCAHLICRPCLLELKAGETLTCRQCRLPFALHEPVLHHKP